MIVVGNITVGGTGKTPLIMALIRLLQQKGYRVGVISRGYKGRAKHYPMHVSGKSTASLVGDEPYMIATQCAVPVVVDPNRVNALSALVQKTPCDIVLSDDGLQHYNLQRALEIAVVDKTRKIDNTFCLPAGPYREPQSRLKTVGLVVNHGSDTSADMVLTPVTYINLFDTTTKRDIAAFSGMVVHAVTGIGHPQRFFKTLRELGCDVIEHAFSDHHQFHASELNFKEDYPIIMTLKDAVKCQSFSHKNMWCLDVNATLSNTLTARFNQKILSLAPQKPINNRSYSYG